MNTNVTVAARTAVLDEAHIGHIHGAFGTIRHHCRPVKRRRRS